MGNLVLAMQEELEIVMDPTFVFHPSEIGLTRFEIMAKTLTSQGFYCNARDCELFYDQYQEYEEMSA
ncbi:hypothetical protein N9J19_00315 [bacterium]|nr:hypothetical protein [bacterium]